MFSSDERWTSEKNKTVRFSPLLQPVAELPTNQRLEGYIVTGIQAFIVLKWNVMLMERQGLWFLSPLFRSVCISRSRLLSILGGRNESPHFSTVFYCANVIHLQCLSMLTPKLILNSKESLNVICTLFPYCPWVNILKALSAFLSAKKVKDQQIHGAN